MSVMTQTREYQCREPISGKGVWLPSLLELLLGWASIRLQGSWDVDTAQLGKYEDFVAGSGGVVCPSTSSAGQQELGGHPLQVHLPPIPEHQWAHLQEECVTERLQLPARGGADARAGERCGSLLPAV
ncbi:hypothetical protein KIL84_006696 [Mauremys mutica]|uniref:Uncharacterized protein n=1 Tax=Mauremys mutica TaxID=74926 RepID=A0A9D3X1W8_9SAUR|nr:hypothetical protein KIL84_006696 [Mauremys mutica]